MHVATEGAVDTARGIDRLLKGGTDLGPLMGVPVAIKDIFTVDGMPTKAGSKMDISDLVDTEGSFITGLKKNGCIILGKTRTIEFAAGAQNVKHPTPWNPWDPDTQRTPGGSSSGSAVALSAGLCAFAVGSDTGGSVRLPAALCGLFGLKTSVGLWSTDGVLPLCPTMDTIGLVANSACDAGYIFSSLTAKPIQDAQQLNGLRLGIPQQHFFNDLDTHIKNAFQKIKMMLEEAGVEFVSIELPEVDEAVAIFSHMIPADLATTLGRENILNAQEILDPVLVDRLIPGMKLSAVEYIRMLRRQNELMQIGNKRMAGLDAWICPTSPVLPIPVSSCKDATTAAAFTFKALQNTRPANIYGYCASTLPISSQVSGSALPIGLQIHCAPQQEVRLLRLSQAVEEVIGMPQKPDVTEFV